MNTKDKEVFLNIDGVGELMEQYCKVLESENRNSHTVIFYGDTGCGKSFFSNECMKKVKEKNENKVIVIDLLDYLKTSNLESERKLIEVLQLIEYDLVEEGAFNELKGKSVNPELFKKILKKLLKDKNNILLIRFPEIEIWEEIEKYHSCLCNGNTILYFITEKKSIVDECRRKNKKNIQYYQCVHLKEGDGKLLIENIFLKEGYPMFDIEELELLMSKRPSDNKMTISELMRICEYSYLYAKENSISCITEKEIIEALVSMAVV